jgi:hypothetical protein
MCEVYDKLNSESYKGYKVVLTDTNGNHFSPYTGIQYKIGQVPKFNSIGNLSVQLCVAHAILNKEGSWNRLQESERLTAVFKNIEDAVDCLDKISEITFGSAKRNILQMVLGGDLYQGSFLSEYDVILGNVIESMEIVK